MSEKNRFTKKKTVIEVSVFVAVCVLAGVLGIGFVSVSNNYTNLSGDYDSLNIDHLELLNDFNNLDNQYFILTGEHIELENDYNVLVVDLADMTSQRDALDSTLTAITAERDGLLAQVDILNAEISAYLTTISGLESQIDDLEAEIIVLETQAIVDLENIADLNAQIGVLESEVVLLESDLTDMTLERDNLVIERDTLLITVGDLEADLITMTNLRDNLQVDLDALQLQYEILFGDYQILFDAKAELQTIYNALLIAYDYMCDTIRQSILPVQYSIFAEAVRRHYVNVFNEDWYSFAEFCRDIVLHDSGQYNAFSEVSNAFSNALIWGNDTMGLVELMMVITFDYCNTINYWGLDELYGLDELNVSYTVIQDCIDNIDYEYDSDIILGQEYFDGDYIKFPVETAFRTMGDCEDQAILTSAYLESCGIETAIVINHDPSHPTLGAFYHGTLWVQIEDSTAFWSLYPTTGLWSIGGGVTLWYWADTTWNVPFGSIPSWLQDYIDFGTIITSDIITLSFCDIGGSTYTNMGENTGLTYVMPT